MNQRLRFSAAVNFQRTSPETNTLQINSAGLKGRFIQALFTLRQRNLKTEFFFFDERFWKASFSVDHYSGLVWKEGVTIETKLRGSRSILFVRRQCKTA